MIKLSKVKFISEKLEMAFNSLLDEDPIKKSIIYNNFRKWSAIGFGNFRMV